MRVLTAAVLAAFFALRSLGTTFTAGNQRELDESLGKVTAGDVVVLRNGQWTNTIIHLTETGTPTKPITVKAETAGQVILTGASGVDLAGRWLVVEGLKFDQANSPRTFVMFADESEHCRFCESAILNSKSGSGNWIHLRGLSNRVDHCRFDGMDHRGVQFQVETETNRPTCHWIDHNFFGNRARGRGNGFETIRIGYSHQQMNFAGATVESNLFYKCNGENEIISNKSTGNRILHNTFLENTGELTLRHGNKALVDGNWFLGNGVSGSGGVRIIGSDHVVINNYFANLRNYAILIRNGVATTDLKSYQHVKNALVAFNTIVDCQTSLVIASGRGSLIPTNCTIANNVFCCSNATLVSLEKTPSNFVYAANIAMCKSAGITNAGFILKDPKLAKDAEGIYRPAIDSPLRRAAEGSFASVTHDISGNARKGVKDVGAQAIFASAKMSRPLTEKEVGPEWMRR